MSSISKIVEQVKTINPELGNLFESFISSQNIIFHIDDYSLFQGQMAGISLRSGVYLNNAIFNINQNNVIHALFVILHESGHYKRYDSIDYDMVSLTNFPMDEYLKKCQTEEEFANNYAVSVLENWKQSIKDGRTNAMLDGAIKFADELNNKFDPRLYVAVYHVIKNNIENYSSGDELIVDILKNKIPLQEKMDKNEKALRKKVFETIKNIFETPEVAPAKPQVKPDVKPAPAKPAPRRILKPNIHPGAKPAPKAKTFDIVKKKDKLKNEVFKNFIKLSEKLSLLENPMNYEDPIHKGPDPKIKSDIEKRDKNPFSKIDVLHKDAGNNQKSLERLGDEEYQDVVNTAKKYNTDTTNYGSILTYIEKVMEIQVDHKNTLERLAKNVVQKYFGIPDEVMAEIFVELANSFDDIDFEMDDDYGAEDMLDEFTPEEQQIIKQNVDKRIISNALMMGAGFRAHNLLEKVKPALDAINPELFDFYVKIMSGHAFALWKHSPHGEEDIQWKINKDEEGKTTKIIQNLKIGGKSELILGDDENGDGIREVKGAKAVAVIFPVLLHETVKAVIEYIFANGLPQYTENINKEIMHQSEKFHFEHWHKLLGPRLWKYLHDAIDYIVQARDSDYTIVAYLLQEIAMLPPNKFLRLVDLLINDGATAVTWLEKMLDRVEDDLANQDIENAPIPQPDFQKIDNLMGQIQDMLGNAQERPVAPGQTKPLNQMTNDELTNFILDSLEAGDFEAAAEARTELESREG